MEKQTYARVQSLNAPAGRVIIVGDIHGCRAQLEELLRTVSFSRETDTLVAVGDLVNKGPDSFGVVRLLRHLGAYSVLGNHDCMLMNVAEMLKTHRPPADVSGYELLFSLAASIPPDVMLYLKELPHILRIPAYNLIVVHAGLHPQRPLEKQLVEEVTTMRNFIEKGKRSGERGVTGAEVTLTTSNETDSGVPWASLWRGPEMVVYGHDARRGLQTKFMPHALGLDSGCAGGGQLSAVVFPGGNIVSVPGWDGSF
ncbi:Calcineurin like phosphoesterase superfamily domain [Trypanosoma vivax]|uniref:Putative diadenosine tetraphosphatase n=1 Tax=Trypanosoma vivax (strain Y486) TaxID=1055687 RepID=G0TZV9_TRYVY|nr:putative diadenosine tetraphosphatase [Trypanosoma vivax]KAH8610780.1 Calcineurin like phosphoesterase superfamily domain [Trypanosoma vivax]CCC50137.1 putative diadenosine tetraphosphatase [Trypanosoma vivax Y486]